MRSKKNKTQHDKKIADIAKKLQDQGYEVQADVSGFAQPDTIGGYRPDINATKGSKRRIIEVETPDSVNSSRDVMQQKAFQQAAKRNQNTTFKRVVTDK